MENKVIDGYLKILNCSFELSKINNLYQYCIDFKEVALVEKLRLYFEQDQKSLYRINIKVIVPDNYGSESVLLVKEFDEDVYSAVCDKAHKDLNVKYFNQSVKTAKQKEDENTQSSGTIVDQCDLNSITLDLYGYMGRYLKIQIELVDTFKTIAKGQTSYPQILIRPEFYGQFMDSINFLKKEDGKSKVLDNFKISEPDKSYMMSSKSLGGSSNISYQLYQIPLNDLSRDKKALLFVMPQTQMQKVESLIQNKDSSTSQQTYKTLTAERNSLKELIDNYVIQ